MKCIHHVYKFMLRFEQFGRRILLSAVTFVVLKNVHQIEQAQK